MTTIPDRIKHFLQQQHVLNLAVKSEADFWAANCFYVFDEENSSLILLTSSRTRHGQMMLANPKVVGLISNQAEDWRAIEGVQFSAQAVRLEKDLQKRAFELYCQRHPIARLKPSEVWQLSFDEIKYTSNQPVFAHKVVWKAKA